MKNRNDLEAVREAIANGGAMTVYESLLDICRDRDAAAQARVGAGATIMRMSGLFDDAKRRLADETDPEVMSAEQMRLALPGLEKELARLQAELLERAAFLKSAVVIEDDTEVDVFA